MSTALLVAESLTKHYPGEAGRPVRALDGVSFVLQPGETLGIVGESGCGKSTLARTLMRLEVPTGGRLLFDGADITHASGRRLKAIRPEIQMIFQDPFGSLNPRHTVRQIVSEPLVVHGRSDRERRVGELLDLVGLPASAAAKLPHEFSGGQRQRVAIARALALSPKVIVADEAVSALDVSIQSQILNLLMELRRELGLSMIFISHDLSVVRHISDRVLVMYLGRAMETASAEALFARPSHPYSQALLSAVPAVPGRAAPVASKRVLLPGEVPDPSAPPSGCVFHPRCPIAESRCAERVPAFEPLDAKTPQAGACACHLVDRR